MHEASFYTVTDGKPVCRLCPHECMPAEGQTGFCGVRKVLNNRLYSTNYGVLAAVNIDPVEKKPLYHFYPGHPVLSLGTYGCNLHCSFCQNWTLARGCPAGEEKVSAPDDILDMLERQGGPEKVFGVAYTYNEPFTWYEFVSDTAKLVHEKGYRNVLVTNGYVKKEPLAALLPSIDAMNIDVKAFNETFYRKYCRGSLSEVVETVEAAAAQCHVEITCLLIPGVNDNEAEQEKLVRWMAGIDRNLVLHYSRYFPRYNLDLPSTPPEVMVSARKRALRHLRYVYLGNVNLPGSSDTTCPGCGKLLIERSGYRVNVSGLEGTCCRGCGEEVDLVMP